jgi:hypothetical protein
MLIINTLDVLAFDNLLLLMIKDKIRLRMHLRTIGTNSEKDY